MNEYGLTAQAQQIASDTGCTLAQAMKIVIEQEKKRNQHNIRVGRGRGRTH